ncbi:hypothetical protein E2C01_050633 [Portunus trituberculatus]|uniref:Uncharacterized protein n=1 Tax=Portunus trituberculatus TaxID=210409 RepID=A0A5B7GI24_PORTR|nr:hypothetical protein [Portunus trituberculatus]
MSAVNTTEHLNASHLHSLLSPFSNCTSLAQHSTLPAQHTLAPQPSPHRHLTQTPLSAPLPHLFPLSLLVPGKGREGKAEEGDKPTNVGDEGELEDRRRGGGGGGGRGGELKSFASSHLAERCVRLFCECCGAAGRVGGARRLGVWRDLSLCLLSLSIR